MKIKALPLVVVLLLVSCATTSTRLTMTWKEDQREIKPVTNVMVMGISESESTRRIFEERFAKALAGAGIRADAGYTLFPSEEKLSKEAILSGLEGKGIDAVLVTHLLAKDKKEKFVPPQTYRAPRPMASSYYRHYSAAYDYVHKPGYYSTRTIVLLETNMYEAKSGALLWSAQSETFDPRSVEREIDALIRLIIEQLKEDQLIP
jgi:hypothetical protein